MRITTTFAAVALALTTLSQNAWAEHPEPTLEQIDRLALQLQREARNTCRVLKTHYVNHQEYEGLTRAGRAIALRAQHIHNDVHDSRGTMRGMRHVRHELEKTNRLLHDMRRVVRRMDRDVNHREHGYGYAQPRIGVSFGHGFRINVSRHGVSRHGYYHGASREHSSDHRTLRRLTGLISAMEHTYHELDEATWNFERR